MSLKLWHTLTSCWFWVLELKLISTAARDGHLPFHELAPLELAGLLQRLLLSNVLLRRRRILGRCLLSTATSEHVADGMALKDASSNSSTWDSCRDVPLPNR